MFSCRRLNRYWGVDQQHNVNASVGMETNSTKYDAYKNITRGYDPERGKQFIVVDPTVYTSYANWMSENVPVVTDNLSNMLSWYGSVSYSYGNWFTVNANVRYDGSNQFGERSNDKLLPIWSASFNYNVMEHLRGAGWFDDWLKMSYGYQGICWTGNRLLRLFRKSRIMIITGVCSSSLLGESRFEVGKDGFIECGCGIFHVSASVDGCGLVLSEKNKRCFLNKEISG
ncbi:MAG: hypothetical protein ACLUDU_08600 [Butyricimonas faecihominis]